MSPGPAVLPVQLDEPRREELRKDLGHQVVLEGRVLEAHIRDPRLVDTAEKSQRTSAYVNVRTYLVVTEAGNGLQDLPP
jgi:hypothetical protein